MVRLVPAILFTVTLIAFGTQASAHCRGATDPYLRGNYEGDCDERTELAQGKGKATGADKYAGDFIRGKPDGKGIYTWQNGARLEGSFKAGKAQGDGVYVSATGVRYEGQFVAGKLEGLKPADCPSTPGPLSC